MLTPKNLSPDDCVYYNAAYVFLRWRRNIMDGRFMPVVVSFALGKSVHVDLVRLAATPRGFVVPLKPVGSIWDVLPRSCSV